MENAAAEETQTETTITEESSTPTVADIITELQRAGLPVYGWKVGSCSYCPAGGAIDWLDDGSGRKKKTRIAPVAVHRMPGPGRMMACMSCYIRKDSSVEEVLG